MIDLKQLEAWFVTGSQSLYGKETLDKVGQHAQEIARSLSASPAIPVKVVFKPVVTTPDAILEVCREANAAKNCIGLVTWMHTFSPAKMWIAGLSALRKPFVHLHTQYNRDIPWSSIDMDFMNLNQSAHGDREFGFIGARMRLDRKVVVGHWQDEDVQQELATWFRAAGAWHDAQGLKIARFGDNMREVAVTEGDKVEAQLRFGYAVHGYGVGDLVASVKAVTDADADRLMTEYDAQYAVDKDLRAGGTKRASLREAARIELGMRHFLEAGGFHAFTTCFEDLHGLAQLPGSRRPAPDGGWIRLRRRGRLEDRCPCAVHEGHGCRASRAERHSWKTTPITWPKGGMKVLGAHMLEVCPSIADGKPSLQMHPLGIGGKDDPARLVFNAAAGPAVNATVIDMGTRFRMVVNEVDVVAPDAPLPKLPGCPGPVGSPAGSQDCSRRMDPRGRSAPRRATATPVTARHLEDFAEIAGIEFLLIDGKTSLTQFKNELRWNAAYYHLARGV